MWGRGAGLTGEMHQGNKVQQEAVWMILSQVLSGSFEVITGQLNTIRTAPVAASQLLPVLSVGLP